MKATVVDLRYRMKSVLKALKFRETVDILYHGKPIARIIPLPEKPKKSAQDLRKHPFFGMRKDDPESVESIMERLRGPRYRDL